MLLASIARDQKRVDGSKQRVLISFRQALDELQPSSEPPIEPTVVVVRSALLESGNVIVEASLADRFDGSIIAGRALTFILGAQEIVGITNDVGTATMCVDFGAPSEGPLTCLCRTSARRRRRAWSGTEETPARATSFRSQAG